MQKFDKEYYEKLCAFLNSQDNIVYKISDITDNFDKFLDHFAFYKANRPLNTLEVTMSFDKTQIKVSEFFDNAYYEEIINQFFVDYLGSKLELQIEKIEKDAMMPNHHKFNVGKVQLFERPPAPTSSSPKSPWDK